jgi:protein involved in polysaccharide export with SLBB domain
MRFSYSRSLVAAAALFLVGGNFGCASSVTVAPLTAEEVPLFDAAANFPHQNYHLEPGDTIQIRYNFHQDMNQEVTVLPDGKITVQLAGEIRVAGMGTNELEKLLVDRTSDRLRNPEVIVSVTKFADRTIYVGGEVERPGTIPYRRALSPLQAIMAAGGFSIGAHKENVILVRSAGPNEKFISRKINLQEIIQDGAKEPIYLAPHDVVYVPKTPIAEADVWVRQHVTELLPFLFPGTNTLTGAVRAFGR